MRLVSFEVSTPLGKIRRIGALRNNDTEVIDLTSGRQWLAREGGASEKSSIEEANTLCPPDMIKLLELEELGMKSAREVVAAVPRGFATLTTTKAEIVLPRMSVKLLAPVPHPRSIRETSNWEEHTSKMA